MSPDITPGVAFALRVLQQLVVEARHPTNKGPHLTLTHAIERLTKEARGRGVQTDLFDTNPAPAQAAE